MARLGITAGVYSDGMTDTWSTGPGLIICTNPISSWHYAQRDIVCNGHQTTHLMQIWER